MACECDNSLLLFRASDTTLRGRTSVDAGLLAQSTDSVSWARRQRRRRRRSAGDAPLPVTGGRRVTRLRRHARHGRRHSAAAPHPGNCVTAAAAAVTAVFDGNDGGGGNETGTAAAAAARAMPAAWERGRSRATSRRRRRAADGLETERRTAAERCGWAPLLRRKPEHAAARGLIYGTGGLKLPRVFNRVLYVYAMCACFVSWVFPVSPPCLNSRVEGDAGKRSA